MYRTETRKQIRSALYHVVGEGHGLPALRSSEPRELAEDSDLLARLVADQLWAEGYELKLRETPLLTGH